MPDSTRGNWEDKAIGWACTVCGTVFATERARDYCEQIHADEEERIHDEAMEALLDD